MSISPDLLAYILELLSPIEGVTTGKMFGGALLKVDGRQLGVIIQDTLYFKVTDPTLQERYADEGSEQFSYIRKDKPEPVIIKNWWSVPARAMDSQHDMVELAEEVLAQTT